MVAFAGVTISILAWIAWHDPAINFFRPALLDTLAAAYAEAGDFPRAISAVEGALKHAHSSGDGDAIKLSEKILTSLREDLAYREEPE